MRYFFTRLAVCLVGGVVLTTPLSAADFAERGTIDMVNLKAGYLVVDDSKYVLAPDVKVYSQAGAAATTNELRAGLQVSFSGNSQAGSRGVITELTIVSSRPRNRR